MTEATLISALDELVPEPADAFGDWEEALARAGITRRRNRALVAAIVTGGVVVLFATPAFGLLRDLIGRIDVPFTGKAAPLEVKRQFFDLSFGAPPKFAPEAIASQARRVATFRVSGKAHVLWVAPTRRGGYCYAFSRAFGGCRPVRNTQPPTHVERGAVHPELLGVTYQAPPGRAVTQIGGDFLAGSAYSLAVTYADGAKTPVRFYFVSKPIAAGFFFAAIPAGHDGAHTRAVAVEVRDKAGRLLARQPFFYETPAMLARERAKAKAMLDQMRRHGVQRLGVRRSPVLPPPTPPLQRGEAGGITAVAGANGAVVFNTSGATARVRTLIRGPHPVAYGCFRQVPFHTAPVDLGFLRTTLPRVAIRIFGMPAPFLGCDIQGTYGHTWPDRLHGHSAVEIPFTPAARRFFSDRAAARDLGLFVRSKAMHMIRKRTGKQLMTAISARYGTKIEHLSSVDQRTKPGSIGFATLGIQTTYVERSTTGRRFFVRIVDGRIAAQNVKPLGFVF